MSRWTFAESRRFIKVAASAKSLDEIVRLMGRSPRSIREAALRMGISVPEQIASTTQLLAALSRAKRK